MISLSYEQRLVWLACLIDGEGHIGASIFPAHVDTSKSVRKRFKPNVGVTNTDVRLINFAAEIMTEITGHVPTIHFACENRPKQHKPVYRLHFSTFGTVHKVLTVIRPYLVAKGEQADQVMLMIEHRQRLLSRFWKQSPEANVAVDGWLNEQLGHLKSLNKRGVDTPVPSIT